VPPSPQQLASHLGLLQQPVPDGQISASKLDAIIVPSARTAPYLVHAAGLAEELNCTLVVLCSKLAKRSQIIRKIEEQPIVADVVAVDLPDQLDPPMPALETLTMFAGTPFARRTDISTKRNLALRLARCLGWRRVVFLDDDIEVPDSLDLRRAVALLETHDGVGLEIGGYPDNSVVCHAIRKTGGKQETFVGGGALAVPTDRTESFFPDIYNEDWFFLLGDSALLPVALIGKAKQYPYDPFVNPDRARREELGDDLAEGIFALLDQGRTIDDADHSYWKGFLRARQTLINQLIERAREMPPSDDREHMVAALTAARGRLALIKPDHCVAFLEAWRRDREVWKRHLAKVQPQPSIAEALAYLGVGRHSTIRLNRTGPGPKEPRLRRARERLDAADAQAQTSTAET